MSSMVSTPKDRSSHDRVRNCFHLFTFRVLRPPGGGSSDIFGSSEPPQQQLKKQEQREMYDANQNQAVNSAAAPPPPSQTQSAQQQPKRKGGKYSLNVFIMLVIQNYSSSSCSAVDGFQTRLRSNEKYTHRSKG